MSGALDGKIAVVTGSTRGIGRGIARALGEVGATVYVTGRTDDKSEFSVQGAAAAVTEAGGEGRAVVVDHGDDAQIEALFARVRDEAGRIDILVNNVFKIPNPPAWGGPFWEHPVSIWDDMVGIGLRAHYVASWHAAPLMFESGPGALVVNVSSPAGQGYYRTTAYGVGKCGVDRLSADMAVDLEPNGVHCVSLYPGSVDTEYVVAAKGINEDAQTPLFVGRSVVALAAAVDLADRSGSIQWVEDIAEEFDLVDERGTRPPGYARRKR